MCQTDRRTDGHTDRRNCCRYYSALHCMQWGRAVKMEKNTNIGRLSAKVKSNRFKRTHCSKQSVVFCAVFLVLLGSVKTQLGWSDTVCTCLVECLFMFPMVQHFAKSINIRKYWSSVFTLWVFTTRPIVWVPKLRLFELYRQTYHVKSYACATFSKNVWKPHDPSFRHFVIMHSCCRKKTDRWHITTITKLRNAMAATATIG